MNLSLFKLKKVSNIISLGGRVVGIDIDDRSIEVAMVEKSEGRAKVKSLGRIVMDFGIVENGRIKNEKKLSILLRKVLERSVPKSLYQKKDIIKGVKFVFGLSDSQVYTQIFTFNLDSKDQNKGEFKEALSLLIDKKVKSSIPLEPKDLLYSSKIVKKTEIETSVLIVATSKIVTSEWYNFFRKSGIDIDYFDIEAIAIFRGLLIRGEKMPVCVVDFGASSTLISIFNKSGLFYSYSVNIAGDKLTDEIVRKLKLRYNQAENYKEKYGLSDSGKKIFPIIIKVLEPVVADIKTALDFYKKHGSGVIQGIVTVGGTSKLRGLNDYLNANLDIKIWSGNSALIKEKVPLEYIEAIGLALGGLDDKYSDLFIKYKEEQLKTKIDFKNIDFKNKGKKIVSNFINKINKKNSSSVVNSGDAKEPLFDKKVLIAIFIVAFVVLAGAFWYRENERVKRLEEIKVKVSQFAQTQQLRVEVPIAINEMEYGDGVIKGRVIRDVVDIAKNYDDALAISKEQVAKVKGQGEVIWENPINDINRSNIIFPLEVDWLVYDSDEANELIVNNIDKLNTKKIDYILNSVNSVSISYSDNPNVMVLISRVVISLHEPFEQTSLKVNDFNQQEDSQKEAVVTEIEKKIESSSDEVLAVILPNITILSTEVGWLNVRSGPGVSYDLVVRINPGESYPLLEDRETWYKIKIDENNEGWISSQYAKKED
ncbi:pilus assembly protein PilM [Patescibacteria group bacterium]|nr:pilus assembly protein PilM [Patescibacteria group bacterium]